MAREGTLFILVGPSGAGKNTLMEHVQDRLGGDLPQLATYTTRAPRGTEQEGVEHHFVTHAEFERLIALGTFVEYQKVHGNNYYGTPRAPIETAIHAPHDLIADIDFLGADAVRKAYPAHTVIVFITPPSLDDLEKRILRRGEISPKDLSNRLARARFELTYAPQCDYLVVNDDLETAVEDLYRIIMGVRAARSGSFDVAVAPHTIDGQVIPLIERNGNVLARPDGIPPRFSLAGRSSHPYEALKVQLSQEFAAPVEIEQWDDNRFDFAPPRYVVLETAPARFTLYYYYRCFWRATESDAPAGWVWTTLDRLVLPDAVRLRALGEKFPAD